MQLHPPSTRSPLSTKKLPDGPISEEGTSRILLKPAPMDPVPSISLSQIDGTPSGRKEEGFRDDGRSTTIDDTAVMLQNSNTYESSGDGANQTGELERPTLTDTTTPSAGRRSVQFARPVFASDDVDGDHLRSRSWATGVGESDARDRNGGSIFSKLRALTSSSGLAPPAKSSHAFTPGGDSIDEHDPAGRSQGSERGEPSTPSEGSEADADAEQSTGDESTNNPPLRKRRRKSRRPLDGGPQTAPTTPKTPNRPGLLSSSPLMPMDRFRTSFLARRTTAVDVLADNHQGVSEDEGRERLSRNSPWRKGGSRANGSHGLSESASRNLSQHASTEERRPSNFRRFTGLGGPADSNDASPFSQWRLNRGERGDRNPSISAAKWRQLKAGLRAIGQRRKAESTIDHEKSAELLAELTAGVPAALILASMFQRDEHGNKRIPILLEQLKVRFADSQQIDSRSGDRHMVFRIELEYGNGLTRMKWVIHRALKDFANLHARYKLQIGAQKYIQLRPDDARTKLPHFPRSTFPYLRGIRGLESDSEDDEDRDGEKDNTGPSGGEASGHDKPNKKKKRRPSASTLQRKSTGLSHVGNEASGAIGTATPVSARKEPYSERQRKKLEIYLQKMIRYLIFRPESNRLCKFLELSALGVRLAAEGSYHGKEGLMMIQSGKGVDFRKAWTPSFITGRHGPKWFAVRHSYVVCVDSPEEMNIYDVFMVDSSFNVRTTKRRLRDQKARDFAKTAKESASHPQHHSLKLYNSERKLKLLAKNERQLHQFEESIQFMSQNTIWAKPNRFDSFAPVRQNVFAQWLVDGRDYMWNVSRAISMAKDVIYIHGWWLSPELYMRRPAAISQKWRLDRLLQRKAREGVKVFVIIYRNINSAIPIDSEYTKFSLLDLHPNVFVQRSPNQIRQNTFFWAHHEKICVVDHMVAFIGGIDLCFGRWDTPQHSVVDDKLTGFESSDAPKDADHCQLWPGKDYSNPRMQDFYALDKPYEEMYDRSKIPRMPWHDISMQIVGQPARDLTRHFVQRWNYILRQRKPTRPTPFLLPPPDFNPEDLQALGLDGTCEVQVLRSTCWWSIGTPDKTEHSIMNAYIKMIEQSEHFVYIENQFFISSCEVEGTRIENHIGDALVERITRAAQKGEDWRAIILIPLMPGFQNTVDSQDGTSVRLIMQCQFRSICRGESSIFSRIRAEGIEPEDYISFYSLRTWGKIGPSKQLVTEQLYIHAKCMVVDDRIAIIGSANINERSMLGSRDSECAAVVRDTDMLWSTMNCEPYLVGRFPHTLRMRLMREHLGIDVDEVMEDERKDQEKSQTDRWEHEMDYFHGEESTSNDVKPDRQAEQSKIQQSYEDQVDIPIKSADLFNFSFNHDIDWEQANNPHIMSNKNLTSDPRVTDNADHRRDVAGEGTDQLKRDERENRTDKRDTALIDHDKEVLITSESTEAPKHRSSNARNSASPRRSQSCKIEENGNDAIPPYPTLTRCATAQYGLPRISQLPPLPNIDDTDIGGPCANFNIDQNTTDIVNPLVADMRRPSVDKDCMRDPLNDNFFLDTWHAVAENNTKLFRFVFRCMPDNEVKTWKEYKEYVAYSERFSQLQGGGKSKDRIQQEAPGSSGPPGQSSAADKLRMLGSIGEKSADVEEKAETLGEKLAHTLSWKDSKSAGNHPLGKVAEWAEEANKEQEARQERERERKAAINRSNPYPNDSVIDEKAASRAPPDGLREFMPLNPAATGESETLQEKETTCSTTHSDALNNNTNLGQKRRRRATTRSSRREFHASDDVISRVDAEELMKMTQGHLVIWPYDWYVLPFILWFPNRRCFRVLQGDSSWTGGLETYHHLIQPNPANHKISPPRRLMKEEAGGNWLYSIDGLAPLEI